MLSPTASNLITIQKFIYLLDEFHYKQFCDHLIKSKSALSLQLCKAIHKALPGFDTHQQLCTKIYGSAGKSDIGAFHQLTSSTFKNSVQLSTNYPGYLFHNISRLQKLINEGKLDEGYLLANALLDVAEKTGNFNCQMVALQFLTQQAIVMNDLPAATEWNNRLNATVDTLCLHNTIQNKLFNDIVAFSIGSTDKEYAKSMAYFSNYFKHAEPTIRIFSLYAALKITYQFNVVLYEKPEIIKIIKAFDHEQVNYPNITFRFLSDIKGEIGFLKMNSPYTYQNTPQAEKAFKELSQHFSEINYRNNYLSLSELNLVSIQVSRLISTYHYQLHRADYDKVLTKKDKEWIDTLLIKCTNMKSAVGTNKKNEAGLIKLNVQQSALQILTGIPASIKTGLQQLESLLITYQQVNLKAATGSIYLCLMTGYFALSDYSKCIQTYRRYKKAFKGKGIFIGNHCKITAVYYLTQWRLTGSRQYVIKMQNLVVENYATPPTSLVTLTAYFKMPVKLPGFQVF